jgi:MFS family permease
MKLKPTTRLYIDAFLQNMKNVCFFMFLPVLIAKMGASDLQISLSNSLPPLMSAFSLAFVTRQLPFTYGVYYKSGILRQIAFLSMAISPLLPFPIYFLLFFWSLNSIFVMITSVQQQAIIQNSIPSNELPTLFGRTKLIAIAITIIGSIIIGRALDSTGHLFPNNYVICMLIGAISTFTGMSVVARLAPKSKQKFKWHFIKPLKTWNGNMLAITVATVGINIVNPLWTIYHINKLGLTNTQIAIFGIAAGLISTITMPLVKKLLTKWGIKKIIVFSYIIMVFVPLIYSFFGSFYLLLLLQVLRGVGGTFYDISQQTLSIEESASKEDKIAFFSDWQLVQNFANGIAPLCSAVILFFVGLQTSFIILSIISLMSTFIILKAFKRNTIIENQVS